MSVEEVNAVIAKLNALGRREIQLGLIQLRGEAPAWKRGTARPQSRTPRREGYFA